MMKKNELHIGNNSIPLNHNLYVAAFGKAALGTNEIRLMTDRISCFSASSKECVEQWMKFVLNILSKELLVCRLVQLNKQKGKLRNFYSLLLMKFL